MSEGFLNRVFGSKEEIKGFEDYLDFDEQLDEKKSEEINADMFIKVAEIREIEDATTVKEEIYNGNIVVMDISAIKDNEVLEERVIKDVKRAIKDVDGDLAGLNNRQIIVTPARVKVNRKVIGGGDFN